MPQRSWSDEQLIEIVKSSTSVRAVIKNLGLIPAGGNYSQVTRAISRLNLKTNHFKGKAWNKGLTGIGKPRIPLPQILVRGTIFQSYKLKARLFKEGIKKKECEQCGWSKTTPDGYLPLELDHVNGDNTDNRLGNLRVLCPNCHSLQPTHRGRNQKRARVVKW